MGATFVEKKRQTDYFFFLPTTRGSKRLKLREDSGEPRLIYYYDSHRKGSGRTVDFQVFPVKDPELKKMLASALGVKTIVKKRREVWKKGRAIFHLDIVETVGKVFEVEIEGMGTKVEQQLESYRSLFGPHLGQDIVGSNEDLVTKTRSSRGSHQNRSSGG